MHVILLLLTWRQGYVCMGNKIIHVRSMRFSVVFKQNLHSYCCLWLLQGKYIYFYLSITYVTRVCIHKYKPHGHALLSPIFGNLGRKPISWATTRLRFCTRITILQHAGVIVCVFMIIHPRCAGRKRS